MAKPERTAASDAVSLIGAGRMGEALIRGWLAAPSAPKVSVFEPDPSDAIAALARSGAIELNGAPHAAGSLVLAVKPQIFVRAAEQLKAHVGAKTRVISIMAGVRLRQLSDRLAAPRVMRAMPNTPGAIGQGITVLAAFEDCAKADIAAARKLLAPFGEVEGPVDESLMAAVTGLSGSGPAYLFLLAEVMAEAGEVEGLPPALARKLARRTVEGAARLMQESGAAPQDLRKAVTSPGGTTQAALDVLMDDAGMARLMRQALRAAINRDRDLSHIE